MTGKTERTQYTEDQNGNVYVLQPTEFPLDSPSQGQSSAPTGGGEVANAYIGPRNGSPGYNTGGSITTAYKVRTRLRWLYPNGYPPPADVKLVLQGSAISSGPTAAERQASNGLGHDPFVQQIYPGSSVTQSLGKRYRKFVPDANGVVEFTTSLRAKAEMSGSVPGRATVLCEFSVGFTNWSVDLNYGTPTYNRATNAQGQGIAVLNASSGDGKTYADTIAPFNDDFTVLARVLMGSLVPGLSGAWSLATSWTWALPQGVVFPTGAPVTYGTIPIQPDGAAFNKGEGALAASTLVDQLTTTLSASDSYNNISDSNTLLIRVHPLREKLDKIRDHAKIGGPYLHNDDDAAVRSKYHWLVLGAYDNGSSTDDSITFKVSTDRKFEQGYSYEKSQQAGADLGIDDIATLKLLFNWTETQSTLSSVGITEGQTLTLALEHGKRTSRVVCYNGTASDWGVSKWNLSGYAGDTEVVTTQGVQPVLGKFTSPVGVPWDGTVGA